jgi:hypothetical protein
MKLQVGVYAMRRWRHNVLFCNNFETGHSWRERPTNFEVSARAAPGQAAKGAAGTLDFFVRAFRAGKRAASGAYPQAVEIRWSGLLLAGQNPCRARASVIAFDKGSTAGLCCGLRGATINTNGNNSTARFSGGGGGTKTNLKREQIMDEKPQTADDPLLQAIQECWPRLPAGIREAIAAMTVHCADRSDQPARRTRHRVYTSDQIMTLKAKITAVVSESPTLPHRMIAARIGIALSTYRHLRLHVTANQFLAEIAAPRSATLGYGGPRAGDENDQAESENENG